MVGNEPCRFYRLGYKMEYPIPRDLQQGSNVPYVKRELVIDLGRIDFIQIEQSSQDSEGCSLLISGHKGAIELPLNGAEHLRDSWLRYHEFMLKDREIVPFCKRKFHYIFSVTRDEYHVVGEYEEEGDSFGSIKYISLCGELSCNTGDTLIRNYDVSSIEPVNKIFCPKCAEMYKKLTTG